jgi:poly(beta-D-mannuronate) lyase
MVNRNAVSVGLRAIVSALCAISSLGALAAEFLVHGQPEFNSLVPQLGPGDTVILAKGEWRDFEIDFYGEGTAEAPIQLRAEEKGQVTITGQSFLRLSGRHLIVSGLVFSDGYTPLNSVIAFRRSPSELAYHSRVTETVIDGFSNPERTETDFWVTLYGRHNRFDHNHLAGKGNRGVTLAVRLDSEESRENFHRIDHNYFGPREILGSNGGETLRIGTSHYSLFDSNTLVESNYFDRCDGELEIISNKSGHNRFRANVFFESRGTLTMRHGNDNVVEDNVFLGNGVDHTGGIRVINARQLIRNNYMEGLAGYRFGGALVVMNGVPNSPINRYHQVDAAVISNNSIIESDHIQLAAGSDEERSAKPINSQFSNNLIANADGRDTFTVYDDVSGIEFAGNVLNGVTDPQLEEGFSISGLTLSREENGLIYASTIQAGASRSLRPLAKHEAGVSWYPKPEKADTFGRGRTVNVTPSVGALAVAIQQAQDGDVIRLSSGEYRVERVIELNKSISIVAAETDNVKISFERSSLFEIQDGGNLLLQGLVLSGEHAPDSAGNALIRTQYMSMLHNYELVIRDSRILALDVNHSFDVLKVAKSTFANRISIENSHFENITGSILRLNAEVEDLGVYNAEYVDIKDSSFRNVGGALVELYRGGNDESTFGPHFSLVDSRLENVGLNSRNKREASVFLHGAQVTEVASNQFQNSAPIKIEHTVGEPRTRIGNNTFTGVTPVQVLELNSVLENTAILTNNQYQN